MRKSRGNYRKRTKQRKRKSNRNRRFVYSNRKYRKLKGGMQPSRAPPAGSRWRRSATPGAGMGLGIGTGSGTRRPTGLRPSPVGPTTPWQPGPPTTALTVVPDLNPTGQAPVSVVEALSVKYAYILPGNEETSEIMVYYETDDDIARMTALFNGDILDTTIKIVNQGVGGRDGGILYRRCIQLRELGWESGAIRISLEGPFKNLICEVVKVDTHDDIVRFTNGEPGGGPLLREGAVAKLPLTGLRNDGNRCYLHGMIQCLNHTKSLSTFFRQGLEIPIVEKNTVTFPPTVLTDGGRSVPRYGNSEQREKRLMNVNRIALEFGQTIRHMWNNPRTTTNDVGYDVSPLKHSLGDKYALYGEGEADTGMQRDSVVALQQILESLNSDLDEKTHSITYQDKLKIAILGDSVWWRQAAYEKINEYFAHYIDTSDQSEYLVAWIEAMAIKDDAAADELMFKIYQGTDRLSKPAPPAEIRPSKEFIALQDCGTQFTTATSYAIGKAYGDLEREAGSSYLSDLFRSHYIALMRCKTCDHCRYSSVSPTSVERPTNQWFDGSDKFSECSRSGEFGGNTLPIPPNPEGGNTEIEALRIKRRDTQIRYDYYSRSITRTRLGNMPIEKIKGHARELGIGDEDLTKLADLPAGQQHDDAVKLVIAKFNQLATDLRAVAALHEQELAKCKANAPGCMPYRPITLYDCLNYWCDEEVNVDCLHSPECTYASKKENDIVISNTRKHEWLKVQTIDTLINITTGYPFNDGRLGDVSADSQEDLVQKIYDGSLVSTARSGQAGKKIIRGYEIGTPHTMVNRFTKLPPNLIISFGRRHLIPIPDLDQYVETVDNREIDFPIEDLLDMRPYVIRDYDDHPYNGSADGTPADHQGRIREPPATPVLRSTKYRLYAVNARTSRDATGGHYIAIARSAADDEWYIYNDHRVMGWPTAASGGAADIALARGGMHEYFGIRQLNLNDDELLWSLPKDINSIMNRMGFCALTLFYEKVT